LAPSIAQPSGDAVAVDSHGPLPAEFAPVNRALAGAFATIGRLVERAVDGDLGEVQADDPVERRDGFGAEPVEHARCDPLVAAGPERGVGDSMFEDGFDVDPRRSGGESDQDRQLVAASTGPG
jgi:hypothetical protein